MALPGDAGAGLGGTHRARRDRATRPGAFVGPRAKLLAAGHRLLLERGDSSYTIEELVRRAGVAIKTFHRCFANKEEFLRTVFTAIVTESAPRIRDHVMTASDDPLERLRLAVTRPLEWHRENEALSRVIAHEHVRIAATSPETIAATGRAYEALMRELVVDAAGEGLLFPADLDWDVHIITSMVTNSFLSLIIGMADPPDRRLLADNVWRFCLTALRAPDPAPARPGRHSTAIGVRGDPTAYGTFSGDAANMTSWTPSPGGRVTVTAPELRGWGGRRRS